MDEEIAQNIMDFYDAALDGDGLGKMIKAGQANQLSREQIRRAAVRVYYEIQSGKTKLANIPLEVAGRVYRLAKNVGIKEITEDEKTLLQAKQGFKDLNRQVEDVKGKNREQRKQIRLLICALWLERSAYEDEIARLKRTFWQKLKSLCKRQGWQ